MAYKNHSQSSSDLKQAAQVVEEACKNIQKVRTDLNNEVQALFSTGWHGPSARTYRNSFEKFDNMYREVLAGLDLFHSKISDSNIQYDRNESEQIELANEVANLIAGIDGNLENPKAGTPSQ